MANRSEDRADRVAQDAVVRTRAVSRGPGAGAAFSALGVFGRWAFLGMIVAASTREWIVAASHHPNAENQVAIGIASAVLIGLGLGIPAMLGIARFRSGGSPHLRAARARARATRRTGQALDRLDDDWVVVGGRKVGGAQIERVVVGPGGWAVVTSWGHGAQLPLAPAAAAARAVGEACGAMPTAVIALTGRHAHPHEHVDQAPSSGAVWPGWVFGVGSIMANRGLAKRAHRQAYRDSAEITVDGIPVLLMPVRHLPGWLAAGGDVMDASEVQATVDRVLDGSAGRGIVPDRVPDFSTIPSIGDVS